MNIFTEQFSLLPLVDFINRLPVRGITVSRHSRGHMYKFQIAINRLSDSSFLECSLSTRPSIPGRDMSVSGPLRIEMTLVKSLYNGDPDVIFPVWQWMSGLASRLRGNKPSALHVLFGLHCTAVHVVHGAHVPHALRGEPCRGIRGLIFRSSK